MRGLQIGPDSWGWKERLAPGALTDSLGDQKGSTRRSTMTPTISWARVSNWDAADEGFSGCRSEVEIDPNLDTNIGRQVLAFVEAAGCARDVVRVQRARLRNWKRAKKKTDMDRVTITRATLYELGPVTNPAYSQTSATTAGSD